MSGIEAIIRTYGAGLSRVAMAYEADSGLREDLLQEILLAIHRALPGLRDASRVGPFVYRIAHNRGVSHIAQEAGRKRVVQPFQDDEGSDAVHCPDEEVTRRDQRRRLADAIRSLPLPYRQVVSLALEGLSYADIGEALDISVSNVGIRLNRAKAMLRTGMGHD